jgi:hypothetical protein
MLERLTRLTEAFNVLEVDQGAYHECRGGNLKMQKIDYLSCKDWNRIGANRICQIILQ